MSGVVALTLAPVWMWSVLVSMCLGLYATYAEVRAGSSVPRPAQQMARPRRASCDARGRRLHAQHRWAFAQGWVRCLWGG